MNSDAGQNMILTAERMHHFAIKIFLMSVFKNVWTVKNRKDYFLNSFRYPYTNTHPYMHILTQQN